MTQAIANGVADGSDSNVVALVSPFGLGPASCTGTLIAKRMVMTAGHCLEDPTMLPSIYFGSDPTVAGSGQVIASVATIVHPLYDPDGLLNDLALIVLGEDAPATPEPLWTQSLTDAQIGATLRLVGFGSTLGGIPGAKYEGTTIIDSYSDTKIAFHAHPSQTCNGDSGGPAFLMLDGVEQLEGVTSSGDPRVHDIGARHPCRSLRDDLHRALSTSHRRRCSLIRPSLRR